jgi:hypothetical protein
LEVLVLVQRAAFEDLNGVDDRETSIEFTCVASGEMGLVGAGVYQM